MRVILQSATGLRARELETLFFESGALDRGFVFEREECPRVGGTYLVGFFDSEPVSCTGWFVDRGVARFRYVYTVPSAHGYGCATTMIRHVQNVETVRAQDELVIFVGEDGPDALYESLGFETVGRFWSALSVADERRGSG